MNGNNCGHQPKNPRFFVPPAHHKPRPHLIRQIIEKIEYYYSKPIATIPSLNLVNHSTRQQRSERRESCLIVLGCLLHYLDLETLRVGIPQPDNRFKGIDVNFIAERCQINLRRTERAIADLVQSKLVTVYRINQKKPDGNYQGFAAIRTITPKLFAIFHLDKRLHRERQNAEDRRQKKQNRADKAGQAKVSLMLDALTQHYKTQYQNSDEPIAKQAIRNIKEMLKGTPGDPNNTS